MKKLVYVISGIVPVLIILLSTFINKIVPFGEQLINIYDSFTQYPGMIMAYKDALLNFSFFYSFKGGLGFNLFGALTYYAFSPLNVFSIFASSENYHMYAAFMTFLRFFLLGFVSSIYFSTKTKSNVITVLFGTIYALMGFTSAYYYNYIWIDSIIMLPIVVLFLEKMVDGDSPFKYIIALSICICINYYIGYMICIFISLYFIYLIINKKNKIELIKRFITASLISTLISMVVIIPSYYALMEGKASIYDYTNYKGFVKEGKSLFYNFTPGSYKKGDQSYGPAQVYSTLFVVVLTVFYFFNKKFNWKEKLIAFLILAFFIASLEVTALNLFWQFFQRPIWWQSRFVFTFSFFLMILAINCFENIRYVSINILLRLIIMVGLIALILFCTKYYFVGRKMDASQRMFLFTSILMVIEYFVIVDDKKNMALIIMLCLIELNINTYNNLKQNSQYKSYLEYIDLKKTISNKIKHLDSINKEFYRMELIDDYSSNDGLYFSFNGTNYFNSARNINVVEFVKSIGFNVADNCHYKLERLDLVTLSLLNIKYLYGDMDYYKNLNKNLMYFTENPYPLSIGFGVDQSIKNVVLEKIERGEYRDFKYTVNNERIISAMLGKDVKLYELIDDNNLKYKFYDNYIEASYKFTPKKNYVVYPLAGKNEEVFVNGNIKSLNSFDKHTILEKGKKTVLKYNLPKGHNERLKFALLDLDAYERAMNVLSEYKLKGKETNKLINIFNGSISLDKDMTLFTTIEYEKGMKIYVDGKKVEPEILFDSLISLDLKQGKHTIKINYIPNGFIKGLILTIIGLSLAFYYKKNYNKHGSD